jgi:cytochrome c2
MFLIEGWNWTNQMLKDWIRNKKKYTKESKIRINNLKNADQHGNKK